MKHLLKTLFISSTLTLALASQAMAQTKVIIGHFGDPAPYKSIVADGSLEKVTGWSIEWRQFNSGAEVNAAMASGGIVISEIGSVPLSAGSSSGLDYQMISVGKAIDSSEALISRNGAGIDKPADLRGKRIAVPIGSTAHFSLMGALKMYNMTEKDVTVVGMSPNEIAAAWSQNAIDAAFVLKAMNQINGDYSKNTAAWNVDSPKVKAVAANVGITPAAVVSALEGAVYPDADLNMSAAWMGGGAATTIKSTADFLKSVGRISAAADNYSKFVNPEFAKAAAGK